jgi:type II secretory pathway predicted ATPase ExeA
MGSDKTSGDDSANLVGQRIGNYRFERVLGRGSMGVVYLASDEVLLRPTAIKVLAWTQEPVQGQDPVQWFLSEARLVARINDPRVVQIYGAARHGKHCLIAMEYVEGQSAEALVAREGPMTAGRATSILVEAATALNAAHRSGVVHRDVKPANLFVTPSGGTKLGDFGLAAAYRERPSATSLRVGTPYFTAPELWKGQAASPASDIYSLGASYYFMLTGRPPFTGADVASVQAGHVSKEPPDPRRHVASVPAACAALVQWTLAKTPDERPESAELLADEARRVLAQLVAAPGVPLTAERERDEAGPHRMRGARGRLASVLRFRFRPFADMDAERCPYDGPPFSTMRDEIVSELKAGGAPIHVLTGPPGSGRSVVARLIAAAMARSRLTVMLELLGDDGRRTTLQRLCSAAGVSEGARADLGRLVEQLQAAKASRGQPPLVVLDDFMLAHTSTAEVLAVVGAAARADAFHMLLVAHDDAWPVLREAAGASEPITAPAAAPIRQHALPPLDRAQVSAYLRAWIDATLPPEAPRILISPDALLLIARRSNGHPERLNCIAENMLHLAAAAGRRVVSSWEAWAGAPDVRWSTLANAQLPRRPRDWPPPDVVGEIDRCRHEAGLAPWPRRENL